MPTASNSATYDARPDLLAAYLESDLVKQAAGFGVTRLLTPLDVAEQSGSQPVFTRESLLSIPNTLRGETAAYNTDDYEFELRTYATQEHGLDGRTPKRQFNRYKSWFDMEMITAARTLHRVLLRREADGVDVITDSAVFTGSLTSAATAVLSSVGTATPVADIEQAVHAIHDATGEWPNCVGMSRKAFREARLTDEFREFASSKGAGRADDPGSITPEIMAEILDIDEVVILGSSKNTANAGQAGAIASTFPDTKIIVCKKAVTSDPMEPCVGRMMHWDGDGSQIDGLIETYYDDELRIHHNRVRNERQFKIFTAELGHVITGC